MARINIRPSTEGPGVTGGGTVTSVNGRAGVVTGLAEQVSLDGEVTRAQAAEATLTSNVTSNTTNISTNTTNIATEISRATAAEATKATSAALTTETTRATTAEAANATAIANEVTRATAAETATTLWYTVAPATGVAASDDTAFSNAVGSGFYRIFVPAGTYVTSGNIAPAVGQTWWFHPKAIVRLKPRTVGATSINSVFAISTTDVVLRGEGTSLIDGNAANQTRVLSDAYINDGVHSVALNSLYSATASFTANDVNLPITGTGISNSPATTISAVVSGTLVTLSNSSATATSNTVFTIGPVKSAVQFNAGATNGAITGLQVANSPFHGIYMQNVSHVSVFDNVVYDAQANSIRVEILAGAPTNTVEGPTISRNTVDRTGALYGTGITAAFDMPNAGGIRLAAVNTSTETVPGKHDGKRIVRAKVDGNRVFAPASPTSNGHEVILFFDGVDYSTAVSNTTHGGSIGISVDRALNSHADSNNIFGPQRNAQGVISGIGVEQAGCENCHANNNVIDGEGLTPNGMAIWDNASSGYDSDHCSAVGNSIRNLLTGVSKGIALNSNSVAVNNGVIANNNIVMSGSTSTSGAIHVKNAARASIVGNQVEGTNTSTHGINCIASVGLSITGNGIYDFTTAALRYENQGGVAPDYITASCNVIMSCGATIATVGAQGSNNRFRSNTGDTAGATTDT